MILTIQKFPIYRSYTIIIYFVPSEFAMCLRENVMSTYGAALASKLILYQCVLSGFLKYIIVCIATLS